MPEQADFIRERGPVTPSPQQSYEQAVEVAVLGAQLVIVTYLDTDEAPDDLIVRTAMIATPRISDVGAAPSRSA
jgi:hypothetical protein